MTDLMNIVPSVIAGQQIGMQAGEQSYKVEQMAAQTRNMNADTDATREKTFQSADMYNQILNRRAVIAGEAQRGQRGQGGQLGDGQPLVRDGQGGWTNQPPPQAAPPPKPVQQQPIPASTPAQMQAVPPGPGPVPMAPSNYGTTGQPIGPSSLASLAGPAPVAQAPVQAQPQPNPNYNPQARNFPPSPELVKAGVSQPNPPQATAQNSQPTLANNGLPVSGNPAYDAAQAKMPMDNPQALGTKGYAHPADGLLVNSFNAGDTSGVAKGKMPAQIITPFANFDAQGAYDDLLAAGDLDGAEHLRTLVTKAGLDSEKIKIETRQVENANMFGAAQAIGMLPPSVRDQQWKAWRQSEIDKGKDPATIPESYDPQYVAGLAQQSLGVADQLKDQHKSVEEAYHTLNAQAAMLKAQRERPDQFTEVKLKDGVYMVDKADPTKKVRVGDLPPSASTNVNLQSPAQFNDVDLGQPLANQVEEASAQSIADGAPQQTVNSRNPRAQLVNARARALYTAANGSDPTGFGTAHGVLSQARKAWAPGGQNAATTVSIDTATGHLADYDKLVDAAANKDWTTFNSISNKLKTKFGWSSAPNNLNTMISVLVPEVLKVVKGAGMVNESEVHALTETAQQAGSPQLQHDWANTLRHAMGSRINALGPNYQAAYPGRSMTRLLRPETVKTFQGLGYFQGEQPGAGGPAPAGHGAGAAASAAPAEPLVPGKTEKIFYQGSTPVKCRLSADGKSWEKI